MAFLASHSPRLRTLATLALLGVVTLGCDEITGDGRKEDKDGVEPVGPPSGSTGPGTGGLGEGGGTEGKPCFSPTTCDDNDTCTLDECIDDICRNTVLADDGDACTFDICENGANNNQPPVVTNPQFFVLRLDNFEQDAGWELGPQWFIDEPDLATNNGDPQADHTPLGTNLAGVARTGFVTNQPVMSYLTSPPITVAPNTVEGSFFTLIFWRRLQSLSDDLNDVVVEAITEGDSVTELWRPGPAVDDTGSGWFEMRLDLTGVVAVSQTFQIRFGFRSSGTGDQSGWNIDDLEVRRTVVPADGEICTLDLCVDQDGVAVANNPPSDPFTVGMVNYECVSDVGPQPAVMMPMP
jgi:hypothetical protein